MTRRVPASKMPIRPRGAAWTTVLWHAKVKRTKKMMVKIKTLCRMKTSSSTSQILSNTCWKMTWLILNTTKRYVPLIADDIFVFSRLWFPLQLLKLPSQTSVVAILEGFVSNYMSSLTSTKNPDRTRASHRTNSTSSNTSSNAGGEATSPSVLLSLCKEVVDGLRVSFDCLLDLTLLYPEERPQYQFLKASSSSVVAQ